MKNYKSKVFPRNYQGTAYMHSRIQRGTDGGHAEA